MLYIPNCFKGNFAEAGNMILTGRTSVSRIVGISSCRWGGGERGWVNAVPSLGVFDPSNPEGLGTTEGALRVEADLAVSTVVSPLPALVKIYKQRKYGTEKRI